MYSELKKLYLKTLDREKTLQTISTKLDNIINEGFEICETCKSNLYETKCFSCLDNFLICQKCQSTCNKCSRCLNLSIIRQKIIETIMLEFKIKVEYKDNIYILSNKNITWIGILEELFKNIPYVINSFNVKYSNSDTEKIYKTYLKMISN